MSSRKQAKKAVVRRGGRPQGNVNPDASDVIYRGPLRVPGSLENLDRIVSNFHFVIQATSDGSGKLTSVLRTDPSSAADWSNFTGSYHEYRVLAMQVRFEPSNRYSKTTTICQPIICVVDHNTSAALTSYAQAYGHASSEIVTLEDPWKRDWRMNDVQEADFVVTSVAPSQVGGVKVYGDGLSVSTVYGMYFITWLVQFRGRSE